MQDRKLGLVGGIVRFAQLHPWRTVEHCTLILLALHLASGRACQHAEIYGSLLCPAGQQQCCCATDTPGPMAVLGAEGVSPAPQPTMSLADLRPGQTVEHHDFRGDIYRFKMGDGVTLNLMKTTAGTMRSGDLHNCTQFDVILEGRARLVTYDTVTKREMSITYGRNDFIKIPARVPHLFEFLEDNYMVEWWDCDFRAWFYQPYRDRISRAFEAAKAREEAAKAGVASAGSASEVGIIDGAVQTAAKQEAATAGDKSRAEAARRQRAKEQAVGAQQQAATRQQDEQRGALSDADSMAEWPRAGAATNSVAAGLDQSAIRNGAQVGATQGDAVGGTDARGSEGGVTERRLQDPVADASDMGALAGENAGAAVLPAAGAAVSQHKQPRKPQVQADLQGHALQQGSASAGTSALTGGVTSKARQPAAEQRDGQRQGQPEEDPDPQMAAGAYQDDYRDQ